ncbi:MAG: xanthine dehydrogenase molybdopterin binding subunit [Bacteroidetes bacterium]|jgi:xanthine dehydrogenase large subunit|nr:xanthine dehydrogenase molybdopterin binding subunit [Bacteroidota bacterium]MBT6685704.1 xanthine dehydrogenase molybdopterin binding subunit [Bacteroidota bacterium]MBT7143499.1 xanthine dehydrogenase molybdopterin binding subunit [Bacteroidota bacterium]MBT7492224.1 xanthine dehydrogenase molybdopterin binding subunit [Bacteroidota bacterium]
MKNKKTYHESAKLHVTGTAKYIDDIETDNRIIRGFVFKSEFAHAKILSFDLSEAKKVKGVHAIVSYKDIPGENQMGPVIHDEEVLASQKVGFIGQAIFLIAAENEEIANEAKSLIIIEFEPLKPVITIEQAIECGDFFQEERKIECGNFEEAYHKSQNKIEGRFKTGAQEHWYLETQVCLALPGEGDEIKIFSSTQNPTETQCIIAEVLNISNKDIEVENRRLGGAFGGKETQANHIASWTALLCKTTKRPVKMRLQRKEDQIMTGKRHPFLINYKAAFESNGEITAMSSELNSNWGYSCDLSMAILERAMLHSENCYYIPNARIIGKAWKTNLPPNTAFRGFGAPQAIAAIELIIDKIARYLKIDAAIVRERNFYGIENEKTTPYGQIFTNSVINLIYTELSESSDYFNRRKHINEFNNKNEFVKKGMAISPVKFGISFTTAFLNQAGALVNIYKDGSVIVNHGGVEMGQGLHTKIQQIAANELGIQLDNIKVSPTNTSKVPNSSPTAASSSTDLNGMAVKIAIDKLKNRIAKVVIELFNKENEGTKYLFENLIFKHDFIYDALDTKKKISFKNAVLKTYLNRESLSATGFYKTPGIDFDRKSGKGNPFFYFAQGMSISEVLLDTLTGNCKILQTDILHDAGKSINIEIDKGQIVGGFLQGVGWCTTEECKWDSSGNLLNNSPETYKIPTTDDIPEKLIVNFYENSKNENTIRQSKAIGEPPFMLGLSVWLALKDAISAVGNHIIEPDYFLPATNENILLSIKKLKANL